MQHPPSCLLINTSNDLECSYYYVVIYVPVLWWSRTPKELHKWVKIMLDAYHLNKEETDIREAKRMSPPIVIQRLFIIKETIEEEYLEKGVKTEDDSVSEEL